MGKRPVRGVMAEAEGSNRGGPGRGSTGLIPAALFNLRANQGFRDLQAQLEGTENRITVARNRYITSIKDYNVTVRSFPSNLTAMVMGYKPKASFAVENEKEIAKPPEVRFDSAPAAATGGAAGTAK